MLLLADIKICKQCLQQYNIIQANINLMSQEVRLIFALFIYKQRRNIVTDSYNYHT